MSPTSTLPSNHHSEAQSLAAPSLSIPQNLRIFDPNELKAEIKSLNLLQGPLTVILLRHGRSGGNERDNVEALGEEHRALKDKYRATPDHDLPLVELGRSQSIAGGRMLAYLVHQKLLPKIDRAITSPFTRPKETLSGAILGISNYCEEHKIPVESILESDSQVENLPAVGERYWHDFNLLDKAEQDSQYELREQDPLFWTPGQAGERMDQTILRARSALSKLYRPSYAGKVVLISTHGEFINAAEAAILELDPLGAEFKKSFAKGIPNCGLYIFSQVPFAPEMPASQLESFGGLQHSMKIVPYELKGSQAKKFSEWAGEPHWQTRKTTRIPLTKYDSQVELSAGSRELAEELKAAGIGNSEVKPRT